MDTDTVQKIIAMLDARLQVIEDSFIYDPNREESIDIGQQIGKEKALEEFRNHLQAYIESQVNQVENEMNRGE